jgi:hypothetical protein
VVSAGTANNIEVNVVSEDLFRAFEGEHLTTELISYEIQFTIHNDRVFSVFEAYFRAVSLRLLTLGNCS